MSDPPLDPFEFELSAKLKEAVADASPPPDLATRVQLGIETTRRTDVAPRGADVAPTAPTSQWPAKLWATLRSPSGVALTIAVPLLLAAAWVRRCRSSRRRR